MQQNKWKVTADLLENGHPTITESTTGIVCCAHSWCTGECGLAALVLTHNNVEYKCYGVMVACGATFQAWRVEWKGQKIAVTLGETSVAEALKCYWK